MIGAVVVTVLAGVVFAVIAVELFDWIGARVREARDAEAGI